MLLKLTNNAPRDPDMMFVMDMRWRCEIPYRWVDTDTIEVADFYDSASIVHLNLPRTLRTPEHIAAAKQSFLRGGAHV